MKYAAHTLYFSLKQTRLWLSWFRFSASVVCVLETQLFTFGHTSFLICKGLRTDLPPFTLFLLRYFFLFVLLPFFLFGSKYLSFSLFTTSKDCSSRQGKAWQLYLNSTFQQQSNSKQFIKIIQSIRNTLGNNVSFEIHSTTISIKPRQ